MSSNAATSVEVESFIAAITDLFWGQSWADVKSLARITWIEGNRSGIEWEAVEAQVEKGWNENHRRRNSDRRQEASLEQLNLFYKLERIRCGKASEKDLLHVHLLDQGLIDASTPPNLTEVGQVMLKALRPAIGFESISASTGIGRSER